ncbi:tyrosine-type recombinase/integrase [Microcella sp.]|uniref:tyrosine-type recombinase/integrase n=1 Tax=Microcella sp. TaxID=1913979 RepID=UPI00391A9B73
MAHDDVLQQFAAYQRSTGLAATTIRNRHSILSHLQHCSGRPLLELTTADLRAHIGRETRQDGKPLKLGTRRTERNAIIAFYTYAIDDGLIDHDPSRRLDRISAPRGKARPFTREQIDAMLTSGAYHRTRVMILLGYYQGFRVSSIARVHGHDIDLLSGTIRSTVKGSKPLVFPLHPVIAAIAQIMPKDDYWFPARGGRTGPIHSGSVTDAIHDAKLRAGIYDEQLTAHSLRHSFGTDLVDAGVDIRVIAELMGHESVATTQIYTAVSAERKRAGIHALEQGEVPTASGRSRAALAA